MTDDQIHRYARHILLPDVGGAGQDRLLEARCAVAVGPDRAAETCALLYLVAAGVGTIELTGDLAGLVTVDEQRGQPVYTTDDVGRARGEALIARLAALNSDAAVVAATEAADDLPTPVIPATPWLAFAPPVAVAIARGGAAACELLARLYRS